jgi:hypothetical protein
MFLVPVCQTKRRHVSTDSKPYRHMQGAGAKVLGDAVVPPWDADVI